MVVVWLPVLAGAYPTKKFRNDGRMELLHAVREVDYGVTNEPLCGRVKADNLCDEADEENASRRCPTCVKKAAKVVA